MRVLDGKVLSPAAVEIRCLLEGALLEGVPQSAPVHCAGPARI